MNQKGELKENSVKARVQKGTKRKVSGVNKKAKTSRVRFKLLSECLNRVARCPSNPFNVSWMWFKEAGVLLAVSLSNIICPSPGWLTVSFTQFLIDSVKKQRLKRVG